MAISKISKITIFFLSFSLLLLLSPLKTKAQTRSITFYLSGDDMQTLYLPSPSKVYKVNVLACSEQNRNGGFQLGIALLAKGIQVAYKEKLGYARSGCPMWSYGGTAEGTAFDFDGTSADALRIIPLRGNGTYYQLYVTYEEGYVPPRIQCGAENTIPEYSNFSVPWGRGGDFILPNPVKIYLVNLYGCCDQNRGGGCSNDITLFYRGAQVAYSGTLRYGRSGCPMWSYGGSPTQYALDFGGVLADTIRAVPTGRCGAAIYRIFYTHEPEQCNQAPTAVATISKDGINYAESVTVYQGIPTPIYLSAASSSHPNGWENVSNGGYCEWNSDLNQGDPTFERKIMNPPSPEACNISLGNLTFNDNPGTYTYKVLRVVDKNGVASPIASVSVIIQAPPPNNPPSATNLQITQPDYCSVGWPAVILSWKFTDPDGDSQSAYQVQVDDNSDFSSPLIDTGKIQSSSNSYATLPGILKYNSTYYWRVKVWDSKGASSNFVSGLSFSTPPHQYPEPKFTFSPQKPFAGQTVSFTDQSIFYDSNPSKRKWEWDFDGDGKIDSTLQNPTTIFPEVKNYKITLKVTDSDSFSCSASVSLLPLLPLPFWKEASPSF